MASRHPDGIKKNPQKRNKEEDTEKQVLRVENRWTILGGHVRYNRRAVVCGLLLWRARKKRRHNGTCPLVSPSVEKGSRSCSAVSRCVFDWRPHHCVSVHVERGRYPYLRQVTSCDIFMGRRTYSNVQRSSRIAEPQKVVKSLQLNDHGYPTLEILLHFHDSRNKVIGLDDLG